MKKGLYILLCLLLMLSILAGCEEAEESKQDISNAENSKNVSEISEEVSTEASDEISEVSEEELFVIVDTRKETSGETDGLLDIDIIFEDEDYAYYFGSSLETSSIIVEYSDGTTQSVKEALADGNITITDLDRFGIRYTKIPKTSN